MSLRLLQYRGTGGERRVIAAKGGDAHFVRGATDVRSLALQAIEKGEGIADAVDRLGFEEAADLVGLLDTGRLIAPIDHPDAAHLHMTGTGLTHLGSAEGRDKMHKAAAAGETLTDSMRMFLEGVEGGKPAAGQEGQQPEWF